jgi:hypothetical protein
MSTASALIAAEVRYGVHCSGIGVTVVLVDGNLMYHLVIDATHRWLRGEEVLCCPAS